MQRSVNPEVGQEGDRDTSVSFSRAGASVFLPEGGYIALIRPVPTSDGRWQQQGGPLPPNSPYQISVTATVPPPCGCSANLVNAPLVAGCVVDTADLVRFLALFGTGPCGIGGSACPLDGDFNADGSVDTQDLMKLLAQFGKSSVNGVCQ